MPDVPDLPWLQTVIANTVQQTVQMLVSFGAVRCVGVWGQRLERTRELVDAGVSNPGPVENSVTEILVAVTYHELGALGSDPRERPSIEIVQVTFVFELHVL